MSSFSFVFGFISVVYIFLGLVEIYAAYTMGKGGHNAEGAAYLTMLLGFFVCFPWAHVVYLTLEPGSTKLDDYIPHIAVISVTLNVVIFLIINLVVRMKKK